jgi:predicted nucleotidyltransferase component of viral defense system
VASGSNIPSRRYFQQFSQKTGFLAITLGKIYRVIQVIGELSRPGSGENLAIRGGTAINLLFLRSLPRLSVDIDLVYVGSYEREKMLEDRKAVDKRLTSVFRYLDYPVETSKTYALDQYVLRYTNHAGTRDSLKVEVNYLACRVPILNPVSRRVKDPFGLGRKKNAVVLAPEELYGSKIKALIERAQPRDLFDVSVLKNQLRRLDFKTLKRATIFYCALELDSDVRKTSLDSTLDRLDERGVKNVLRPTLAKVHNLDLEQLKSSANSVVSRILELDRAENDFLDSFYSGDYRPELLFPKNELLRHHPGAAWRMRRPGGREQASTPE